MGQTIQPDVSVSQNFAAAKADGVVTPQEGKRIAAAALKGGVAVTEYASAQAAVRDARAELRALTGMSTDDLVAATNGRLTDAEMDRASPKLAKLDATIAQLSDTVANDRERGIKTSPAVLQRLEDAQQEANTIKQAIGNYAVALQIMDTISTAFNKQSFSQTLSAQF